MMIDKAINIVLILAIVVLYGLAGALDNDDSDAAQFVDNLTHSNQIEANQP